MVFNSFKDKLANSVFLNKGKETMPKQFKIGFSTTEPSEEGGNITQPGGNYTRKTLTLSSPLNGSVSNENEIDFGEASVGWGTVQYAVIFDENDTALFATALSRPIEVKMGDIVKVKPGDAKLFFGEAMVGV